MRRLFIGIVVLGGLSMANVCGPPRPPISFVSPAPDAEVTWMPTQVKLRLRADMDESSLAVRLNGTDVTAEFLLDVLPSGVTIATAEAVWGPGILLPGTNVLDVDVLDDGGAPQQDAASFEAVGDPYADAVLAFGPGAGAGFGTPDEALGPPTGGGLFAGSLDVVSLGLDGWIELEFADNVLVDGPGVDFTVFENAFLAYNLATFVVERPFAEPARVLVSQDGSAWTALPCALEPTAAFAYPGCAGVLPVYADADDPTAPHASLASDVVVDDLVGQSALTLMEPVGAGGDSFDLADAGLAWARYVRLEAADFTLEAVGPGNAGFDLDALAAVHSAPATDADANGIPDAVE